MRGFFVRQEKMFIKRFLLWQLIVTLVLTLLIALLWNRMAALSTFFGGMLAILPNIFFTIYFLICKKGIYIAETLKIILTALLLVVLLHYFSVALLPLLVGLMGTYSVYFFRVRSR